MNKKLTMILVTAAALCGTGASEIQPLQSKVLARYAQGELCNLAFKHLFCPVNHNYILTASHESIIVMTINDHSYHKLEVPYTPVYGWLDDNILLNYQRTYKIIPLDKNKKKKDYHAFQNIKYTNLGHLPVNLIKDVISINISPIDTIPSNNVVLVGENLLKANKYITFKGQELKQINYGTNGKEVYKFQTSQPAQLISLSPDSYKILSEASDQLVYNLLTNELIKLPRPTNKHCANAYY